MTLTKWSLNGTDGTTATAANTGLTLVTAGSGNTRTLSAGAASQGSTGLRVVQGGTNADVWRASTAASNTAWACSFVFRMPASAPAADAQLFTVRDSSGSRVISIFVTSGGGVQIGDFANTRTTILSNAQGASAYGALVRIELVLNTGGGSTARAYGPNSSTSQFGSTANIANVGTTAIQTLQFYGVTTAGTYDIDSIQANDGGTSEIGAFVANSTPPVVTASANQTSTTGASVNVSVTATAQNGDTIASYAWSFAANGLISTTGTAISAPAITNGSTATASFTPTVKGRYILQCVVTDSSGNQTTVTTRVFVPDSAGVPIEYTTNNGFTGAVGNLNDNSDSTTADSGAPGAGTYLIARLSPLSPATTGWTLDVRSFVTAIGGTQQVRLYEGATLRKDWGAISPSATVADQLLTLSTSEMATIGSWNELDLRFDQV